LIGIRDREEFLCWEVESSCHGPKTRKIFNRSDLSAFQWPYYAHALSERLIIINYLTEDNLSIFTQLELEEESDYIHKLCFSNSCDLFVLVHSSNKRVSIYRISVGRDTSIEFKATMGEIDRNSIMNLP
jgi:hypothetical protein